MKQLKAALLLLLLFSGNITHSSVEVQLNQDRLEPAISLFKEGRFAEAEKICSELIAREPKNYQAVILGSRIALLANDINQAQKLLTKAIELNPQDSTPKTLLAEAYYRRDNFQRAAALLASAGRHSKARKLESFKGTSPYRVEGEAQSTRLKFIHTDPLPLVQVRVNGGDEVNFLIDTGGGEVIIDAEFAKQIGATQFGTERWTFGGDQKADMGEGKVESLTLGDFIVKNVPVNILSTRRFSAAARGKRVDGIIGTVLLYHFISTLDYVNGELILRRRTEGNLRQVAREVKTDSHIVIPFWLAGDHLMVAWGKVNNSKPVLFYVDTGLAGMGFTGPQSVIDEAGIKLPVGAEAEGVGGGGKVKIIPFRVEELYLGDAKEKNIGAVFGPFPASLESKDGFRIAGIISHQFFRPYALTMDFTNMKLYLKRKPI